MQAKTVENKKTLDPTVWVDRHGDYLFAFAFLRLRDESAAEDIVQETFLTAIQSFDPSAANSEERKWLTEILRRKIIDLFRRNCQKVELTDDESDMSSYQYLFADETWKDHWTEETMPSDWQTTPEKELEKSEFCAVLEHCLGELPVRIANAFTLHEIDRLGGAEICDILHVSKENYWTMLHRARTHLRRCLEYDWFRKSNV